TAPSMADMPCVCKKYWRTPTQTLLEQSKMTDPTHDSAKDDAAPNDTGPSMDADWAAAMSEQSEQTRQANQAEGLNQDADDWASALAEQTATQRASAAMPSDDKAPSPVFRPLVDSAIEGNSDIDMIMDIP